MRRTLSLAVAGIAAAAFLGPVQSASAVCGPDLSWVGGPSCPNLCPTGAYDTVDRAVEDRLPDFTANCFA